MEAITATEQVRAVWAKEGIAQSATTLRTMTVARHLPLLSSFRPTILSKKGAIKGTKGTCTIDMELSRIEWRTDLGLALETR
jgi:hypothetical protein